MANANRTVKKFRERAGFTQRDRSNTSTGFAEFVFQKSQQGVTFANMEDARKAFEAQKKNGNNANKASESDS